MGLWNKITNAVDKATDWVGDKLGGDSDSKDNKNVSNGTPPPSNSEKTQTTLTPDQQKLADLALGQGANAQQQAQPVPNVGNPSIGAGNPAGAAPILQGPTKTYTADNVPGVSTSVAPDLATLAVPQPANGNNAPKTQAPESIGVVGQLMLGMAPPGSKFEGQTGYGLDGSVVTDWNLVVPGQEPTHWATTKQTPNENGTWTNAVYGSDGKPTSIEVSPHPFGTMGQLVEEMSPAGTNFVPTEVQNKDGLQIIDWDVVGPGFTPVHWGRAERLELGGGMIVNSSYASDNTTRLGISLTDASGVTLNYRPALGADGNPDPQKWLATDGINLYTLSVGIDPAGNPTYTPNRSLIPPSPKTYDLPGLAGDVLDAVYFWNPIQAGVGKAGVNALVGIGGILGWWDEIPGGPNLYNLPSQQQSKDGFVDLLTAVGQDYLYLQLDYRDAAGNRIYSPGGNLDRQQAVLNAYNDLSKLVIGTDWSQFEENPWDTVGSAVFGIGTFLIPGPKGMGALTKGAGAADSMGGAGRLGAVPDTPWPELPRRAGPGTPHRNQRMDDGLGGSTRPMLGELALEIDRLTTAGMGESEIIAAIRNKGIGDDVLRNDQISAAVAASKERPGLLNADQSMGSNGMIYGPGGKAPAEDLPLGRNPFTPEEPKPPKYTPQESKKLGEDLRRDTPATNTAHMEKIDGSKVKAWTLPGRADLSSQARGKLGESFTRAQLELRNRDLREQGVANVADALEQGSVQVPLSDGTFVEIHPDFIYFDPETGTARFYDSKFSEGASYTENQLDGYRALVDGKNVDGIRTDLTFRDLQLTDRALRWLRENRISLDTPISGVETHAWNTEYMPDANILAEAQRDLAGRVAEPGSSLSQAQEFLNNQLYPAVKPISFATPLIPPTVFGLQSIDAGAWLADIANNGLGGPGVPNLSQSISQDWQLARGPQGEKLDQSLQITVAVRGDQHSDSEILKANGYVPVGW
ncbi:hypothetical protein [Nocardia sp. NPDC127526]|uniref:hypothetical protein n=1 Tax=Nocardia sp. NPDC127526 TaxID=3345393 RepID=UPI0036259F7A